VSTGDKATYDKYQKDNSFKNINDNVLLVPYTPQIEILKRADLFITHAGMNSVNEAIHYGVPIITLPLSGDQPFVAWRVADELKMGILLQPNTLSVEKVINAINEITNNPIYRQKAKEFSLISKQYKGHVIASNCIIDYVNKNELNLRV
jgi:UDP:flavonoid glycosyltransferase YjiC (YdhE family)